jgi:hypothetical protein
MNPSGIIGSNPIIKAMKLELMSIISSNKIHPFFLTKYEKDTIFTKGCGRFFHNLSRQSGSLTFGARRGPNSQKDILTTVNN